MSIDTLRDEKLLFEKIEGLKPPLGPHKEKLISDMDLRDIQTFLDTYGESLEGYDKLAEVLPEWRDYLIQRKAAGYDPPKLYNGGESRRQWELQTLIHAEEWVQ
ncbi:hypothetical protein Pan216_37160 [Planctomycetes bacterium Pan216]|uniref:Uncharacterized protein n=1 Tax=Kolteria novifilia TaxID=2527975 RepID=A0A518B788_9BACT|nr:hypothetical protein Pan216_37160 [Planctomycetes bacterium Pan216]